VSSIAIPTQIRSATRPTWAEVSLSALRRNFQLVQSFVGAGVNICAVVKADAYGHGAVECARALVHEGAQWFGVTGLDEAIPLRNVGIESRILLMTGFWRGEQEEIVRLGLTPTIWERGQIELLSDAVGRMRARPLAVHLKIDTGMGRLGVLPSELPAIIKTLQSSRGVFLEGVSTHLASSEVLDSESVERQTALFRDSLKSLRAQGFDPPLTHIANTSAMLSRREVWNTMVRPGLALYGYSLPFEESGRSAGTLDIPSLTPALTWKTRILSLRDLPANQALGYGGTYITKAPSRIAVLPVGYADGLNRKLSSRGRVIVRGNFAPIVGRISMDLTLVDVTAIPSAETGDEVVLLGTSDGLSVSALEHAALAETIPYEILCNVSKRVPRKYIE
jgi:alanine racemase